MPVASDSVQAQPLLVAPFRQTGIDVLLAHSYCLQYDAKQQQRMRPYPPLALLYAASLLRSAGYTVALFDSTFSDPRIDFPDALRKHRPRFLAIFEDSFNFVIKMCLTRMRETALRMAEAAVEAGATVIAAGPDVSDYPEHYLGRGVTYALLGEAELALRELLDVLAGRSTQSVSDIPGVCVMEEGGAISGRHRRLPERQPDRFPFPAWDLVDIESYRSAWIQARGHFSLNLATSRGCPYRCNWCAKPIWGHQYAVRSPANVADEMALVKHNVRPEHIWFADDIFGLRPSWVEEFAHEVVARDAVIPFTIQSRVDRMTEAAVLALQRAGCAEAWLGAESGSQAILDAMEKGTSVGDIPVACQRLKAAGIRVGLFLQFGYPGETLEDIMATVEMVRECLPDQIGVSVSYPLPGTPFHERVQALMGPQSHWAHSGDLAMMFSGPYGSAFYRKLHDLIHEDLALRHKIVAGEGAALLPSLDRLNRGWFDLGQMEVVHRNERPTQLAVVCDGSRALSQAGAGRM